jgi:uncharacterized protein
MTDDDTLFAEESPNEGQEIIQPTEELEPEQDPATLPDESGAAAALAGAFVELGFVNFDGGGSSNASTGAMVSPDRRRNFRRDVYVGIRDAEQGLEFLGRVVEGPFHAPHEVGPDSAITRTTVLHPERTKFRPTYYVYGTIEVLGQLVANERVIPTPTRPRPYSEIYIFPPERLQRLLGIEGNFFLGHLMGYEGVQVFADSDNKNFLPRNLGIFGTVGSGKSNTTQVVIEEALYAGWAVIVVDVEGEYVRMNEPTDDQTLATLLQNSFGGAPAGMNDMRVFVPTAGTSDALNPTFFKVPIAAIQPELVADIMEFSEPQFRVFTTALTRAPRWVAERGQRRTGGLTGAPVGVRPYSLQDLIDGLGEDQSGNIPLLPNAQTPERTAAYTLRSKLIQLGRSGMLDWNANNSVAELPVDDLLTGGRLSILDVSETDDRSRNIAIAYTLQTLFERVIETEAGQNMPNGSVRPRVLVVIEEVHTFVSRATASKMRSVLDNLQIISRRGRKRWMALALVSQQPGHVPDELFELVNTRFIHQLKSAANLAPVRQTTGGVHEALWGTLPSLGPGQCLLTGATFRNPIFVEMRPAKSRRLLTS